MILLLKYFIFLFWLGCMLICGMFLFTRGFLLNREVLHFYSSCKSSSSLGFCDIMFNSSAKNEINGEHILECTEENVVSNQLNNKLDSSQFCFNSNIKVILLLIDALSYDFVLYNESLVENIPPYKNKLPFIDELLKKEPDKGRLYKFIADPPTTTMQRLNGLTTGSLPTFIDVGSNFDTSEINEDNLIDQLVKAKKNITFMGDETLTFMYPGRFRKEYPYPSFNVWDLDSVDSNVRERLVPEVKSNDWDIIIAHFLGVDHCGHTYGPFHSEMARKLTEMNEVIRSVVAELDNNTILFVIGDHGMTATGDHGGASEEEVTSAMFVYSNRAFIKDIDPVEEVRQVDLVPTLASIMGTAIPFSNLGKVVVNVLPSFSLKSDLSSNWEYILIALWTNIKQVTLYIQEYAKTKEEFPTEKLAEITDVYKKLRLQVEGISGEEELLIFINDSTLFMHDVREMCAQVWAQYDTMAMSRGLVLYFLLVAFAFIVIEGTPIHELDGIIDCVLIHAAYGLVIISLVVLGLLRYLDVLQDAEQLVYFCVCTLSVVCLCIIVIINWSSIACHWYEMSKSSNLASVFCRLITLFSFAGLFSNSYIINETFTCHFLLISLVFVSMLEVKGEIPKKVAKTFELLQSLKSFLFTSRGKALSLVFVLFLLLRISAIYIVCRVEQNCVLSKPLLTESSRCLLTIVFIAVFITAARLYLRSCGNLVGFSPTVFVSRYAPTAIVIATGGFWILQSLPHKTQHKLLEPWQLQILPRTAMCLLIVGLSTLFIRPLSVYHVSRHSNNFIPYDNIIPALFNQLKEVMVRRTGSDVKGYPVVFGLATVYSACYINVSVLLTLLAVLLLGSETAAAAVLMTLSLWTLAVVTAISRQNKGVACEVPWWCVVAWGLSSIHFFYATGHQASFSTIDWKSAFLLSPNSELSSYIVPAVLVIGNVFSSHILHATLLPLLVIVPQTLASSMHDAKRAELNLFERDRQMNRAVFKLIIQYMLFFSLRVFGCMLAASIHARHLMVWSIFTPKLIFEGIGFVLSLPFTMVGFFLLQRITTRLDSMLQDIQRICNFGQSKQSVCPL
ncbi:GPI ethanolamine phosphate transferase 3-like [Macrosteles quadrilineatus]|uniref:GPI ethanolamine phosphate transferase 3-like n=1 Tax=Macrosteles quadrilineatus TaxID=74068 RepID=UPI0023E1546B|nr:GPI ethanolamine phosphate transferase 3-like [Macrosteles quadrilineatus]